MTPIDTTPIDTTLEDGCKTHILARDFTGDFEVSMHQDQHSNVEYIKIYDHCEFKFSTEGQSTVRVSVRGLGVSFQTYSGFWSVRTDVKYISITKCICGSCDANAVSLMS